MKIEGVALNLSNLLCWLCLSCDEYFFFGSLSNKYSTLRSQSRPRRFPFNNCGPIFDGNETDWKTTVNKSKQTEPLGFFSEGESFKVVSKRGRAQNATSINFLRFPFGNVLFLSCRSAFMRSQDARDVEEGGIF